MSLIANPYQFSNPVYHPEKFFDRQYTINRLYQAILSRRSVQLPGQYRIGKSSLLRYIQIHLNSLIDERQSVVIYYDLTRRPHIRDGNDFFARIWQLMSNALVERGYQSATLSSHIDLTDSFEFDEYVQHWTEEGIRFIFLLDEFGFIARNKNFDANFLENIRSTIPTLTYVFATPRSLAELAHKEVSTSPLWGVLELIRLLLLEKPEDAYELIRKPVEGIGLTWPERAEQFIYERGGQFPCYLQMAASALYDTQVSWQMNYKQADQIFKDTATEHFRYFWTKTLSDEYRPEQEVLLRQVLLDLAHGRTIDDDLAEDLKVRSLVWFNEATDNWELFSAWFANWLLRWSSDKGGKQVQGTAEQKSPLESTGLPLQEGQLLEGKYRAEELIGSTSHSQVVRAYDEQLKRKVTIKCPRLDRISEDEALRLKEIFKREAQILACLNHRRIGSVYQALLNPLGIVMEWIHGLSLQDIIDAGECRPASDVIQIGIDLAEALEYLHQFGIIHRDIKPGNIILSDSRGSVLIDFGIARTTTHETITLLEDGSSIYVGTKPYSAPEQFLNPEGVGGPTDLFALGVVLYQLLTGKLPFKEGNLPSLYDGGLPKPDPHNIPASLYEILCELLNEKPDHRPNATILKEKLQSCK